MSGDVTVEKISRVERSFLIVHAMQAIVAAPDCLRAFEHEQKQDESFADWARAKAISDAKAIWKSTE